MGDFFSMAKMFVTYKVMPESPDTNLKDLRTKIQVIVTNFGGELLDRDIIEPVAFGLMALKLMIIIDESKGSEDLGNEIGNVSEVSSVDVVDMRRAVG